MMTYKIFVKHTSQFILGARFFVYLINVLLMFKYLRLTSVHLVFEALVYSPYEHFCTFMVEKEKQNSHH